MTPDIRDQVDEEIRKQWRARYGNISEEMTPPVMPLFRDAVYIGIAFAISNLEMKGDA